MANGDPKFTKLDKRIYKNIQPLGYSNTLGNILPAIGNIIVGGGRAPVGERREDMWRYALGGREPTRSFNKSKYAPSISQEQDVTYYTPKDYNRGKFLNRAMKALGDKDKAVLDTREGGVSELPYLTFSGDITVGRGEDERGQYVSFYDKWDLKNPLANKFLDRTPEIYDRVYYEKGSDNNYIPVEQNNNKNKMSEKTNKVKYQKGGPVSGSPSADVYSHNMAKTKEYGKPGEYISNPNFRPINRSNMGWYLNQVYPSNVASYLGQTESPDSLRSRLSRVNDRFGIVESESPVRVGKEGNLYGNQGFMIGTSEEGDFDIKEKLLDRAAKKVKNYEGELPEYNLGGWIGENKQGILGGALALGGAGAMFVPGLQGAGMGMISSGAGMIGSEIQGDKQAAQQQQAMQAQQTAQAAQAQMQPQHQSQYTSPYQMPMGGMIPYGNSGPNAELEKGETYRTPAGVIKQVPQGTPTHKNGGIDMNLPKGTQVLGDLKNSDNKEYKELGRRLERAYNNYKKVMEGKPTPIAKRTAEKMLAKVNKEYMDLMQQQESQKTSGGNRKMQEGGTTGWGPIEAMWGNSDDWGWGESSKMSSLPLQGMGQTYNANNPQLAPSPYNQTIGNTWTPSGTSANRPLHDPGRFVGHNLSPELYDLNNIDIDDEAAMQLDTSNPDKLSGIRGIGQEQTYDVNNPQLAPMSSPEAPEAGGQGINWGKVGTGVGVAAQFAPALYNIGKGLFGKKAQTDINYQQNPYKQEILNLMRDRRYDVRPQLQQANIASRTAERNLRETAPSSAQYLANLAALQGQDARTKANIYGRKENVENQYRQQNASMLANMGSREAQRRQQLEEANLNRRLGTQAAKDRLISTGMSQLGAGARGVMQDVQSRRNTEMWRGALNQYLPDYDVGQQGSINFNPTRGDIFNTAYKRYLKNNN